MASLSLQTSSFPRYKWDHPASNTDRIGTKRIFDIAFSSTVLLFGSPLYFLIASSIFISEPGSPIIFAHERVGLHGKPFKCYKFRTMCPGAEAKLHHLLQSHPALAKEWEQHYQLKNDPRVTRLGKILRKTSLDELPQFWNVLKGDLSIVGPRPITQKEVEQFYPKTAAKLLSVRPGITGLAQVQGRNEIDPEKKVKLNLEYIERQSFLLDLKIILKTLPVVLSGRGAS